MCTRSQFQPAFSLKFLVALAIGGLAFALATRAAESPGRFLLVTNWHATFTHSLNVNGSLTYIDPSGDDCTAHWHFIHDITVACRLVTDPQTASHPYFREFDWKTNDSGTIHVDDKLEWTCVDPDTGSSSSHSYTVNDTGQVPTNFSLTINTDERSYSVVWVGVYPPISSEIAYNGFSFPGNIGLTWSPEALTSNALPATGMLLQGTTSYAMKDEYPVISPAATDFIAGDPKVGGTSPLGPSSLNGSLVLTWSLTPDVEELEVIVEPRGYADWIPEGKLISAPVLRGNSIPITARLQKKGGGVPQTPAQSFKFSLSNISKMPGVCMNFPLKDPTDDNDLKFEEELNAPRLGTLNTINDDQTEIEIGSLGDGLREVVATISSFDFGAYGELKVEATVAGFTDPIVGHLKNETTTTIPIPKVNPVSHISVAWLRQNGGGSGTLPDDLDEEGFPEGDGHKGDGLSLYEEYRGFSVGRVHVRTKPVKKDLFIRDQVQNGQAQQSILEFKSRSQLEVHHKLLDDEINADGVINFNHDWAHNLDQHGLILVGRQKKLGYSVANSRAGALHNSTPGSKSKIELEPAGSGFGLDLTAGGTGDALEYSQFTISSAAHEIAHGCSVWHHGDCDIDGDAVGLRWVLAPDGSELEVRNIGGTISQTPITILNADGTAPLLVWTVLTNPPIRFQKREWMAVPQGQHSGDVECIMTYRALDCFRRDMGDQRFVSPGWSGSRAYFCTSPAGTGVNASAPGGAWLGGAAQIGGKNRGNCAGQICVNDLYVNDGKHNRDYACPPW